MSSSYSDDIEMIVEELKEYNIKHYSEVKKVPEYGEDARLYLLHAKISTPEELQLLVEKVAAGGIEMSFEFKSEKK
jgi:hypothetical protein